MKLLFFILPSIVLSEDDQSAKGLRGRRLPHMTTFDGLHEGEPTDLQFLGEADAPAGYVSMYDHLMPDFDSYNPTRPPVTEEKGRLPSTAKPDICAIGKPGHYRPREGTSNCAKTVTHKDTTPKTSDSVVTDPRRPIFNEQAPGYYKLQVNCDGSYSDADDAGNINLWYSGQRFHSIDQRILEGWDRADQREGRETGFGFEPISGHDSSQWKEPELCMAAAQDHCHEMRKAACEIQRTAVESGDAHAELMHRVGEFMECSNKHQEWKPCEKTSEDYGAFAKYQFWGSDYVDSMHLNTLMPNGINLVPQGGGSGPVTKETDSCIAFAVSEMCMARKPCGPGSAIGDCKCRHGHCELEEYCREYRQTYPPRLIHQEGGTGMPYTDSNGEWVPRECVDPDATWIVLLWDHNSDLTPPKGSMTVFGCPSQKFEGCGSGTMCGPFQSWKGWVTSAPLFRTDYTDGPFCTLWHQQYNLEKLFHDNDDPKMEGEYHPKGYLQPEVCYQNDDATPFDKCVNLSPDNCHFREGTKFDPVNGQFYHDWNFQLDKWFYPRFGDSLDWRKMLPVCFGCDFEQCGADGADADTGKGTCGNIDELHDHRDDAVSSKMGFFSSPLWYKTTNKRSPLEQMTNPSGSSVVRDQGSCGSCWAFTSMSTASHLMCIADCKDNDRCLYDNIITGTNWLDPWQASVQSIMSCNSQQAGCDGGWMRYGDEVFQDFGVMKEKNFPCAQVAAEDSADGFGYTDNANLKQSCADHYEYACADGDCQRTVNKMDGSTSCNGGAPALGDWNAPHHEDICQNQWGAKCPYSWDYWQYPATSGYAEHTGVYNLKRVQVTGWYNVASGSDWESQYKDHLYNVGPFGVAFDVYNDFPWNGCSGVDEDHVWTVGSSATKSGGHGVTMIGYGWAYNTCSGCTANLGCTSGWMKYWQIQNSWGRSWGNGGYFRIRRGTDEARIESWAATAPSVDVNCNESNKYYGGEINYPMNIYKAIKNIDQFVELMEQIEPLPPKSADCPAADWDPKKTTHIGGFEIVHNFDDVVRR